MSHFVILLSLIIFPALAFSQNLSRDVVSVGGGSQATPNIQLSYTIGEAVAQTFKTPSLTITQGFEQGKLEKHTGINKNNNIKGHFNLTVYPNPTKGEIYLKLNLRKQNEISVKIHNALGQVVYRNQIIGKTGNFEKTISLKQQPAGVYYLNLRTEEGLVTRELILQK